MIYRVLVVDDFEPWRRSLFSLCEQHRQWEIVGECADGLEAVEKAQTLKPDLILLDVSLPTLNGIQAAQRILSRDPNVRILFLSEHASWDIAEAALATGARGYLVKSHAGTELLAAMDAIVEGKPFISAWLTGRVSEPANEAVLDKTRYHEAGFYSDEADLLDSFTRFAEAALEAGHSFVMLAVESRRLKIHQELRARGHDIDRAIREGRYVSLDVSGALEEFMVDGWPDETRFRDTATSIIAQAARASTAEPPRVAACGECAPLLWREDNGDAAIRLEQLWDEVARTFDVDVLCGYLSKTPRHNGDRQVFERICAEHSAIHSR